MARRKTVAIGLLGTRLDAGVKMNRWERWRPTVSLCQQDDLIIDRLEILHQEKHSALGEQIAQDIDQISPETEVRQHFIEFEDPWDFEQVFAALHDFARDYPFDTDREEYLVNISTGSHVAQICLFLLTESRHFPARMVQTSPRRGESLGSIAGVHRIIDLDLSRYDQIAARFQQEQRDRISVLKSGINTRNVAFNRMIDRINTVSIASTAPILLTGPTGAGKSQLAGRIYAVKKERRLVEGPMVEINCATVRGDAAMSALFGHRRGSFTGAVRDRPGLLKRADGGMLFLDEIGELGLDEQAMLLRAIETGSFRPVGADTEDHSRFQLIAGTNRDLAALVAAGAFRADLLSRINLWHFRLPGLSKRPEDIPPNLDYELERFTVQTGRRVTFSREARERFLAFATSPQGVWAGNFRDLSGAVQRMATLAPGGRISNEEVDEEIARLQLDWSGAAVNADAVVLSAVLSPSQLTGLDRFDRVQLADVIAVCAESASISEAGRTLFAESRKRRRTVNDADRLRKYLSRFSISFQDIHDALKR